MSEIFDIESEFKALGLALDSFDNLNEIISSLDISDFFEKRHSLIFFTIRDLYKKGIAVSVESISDSLGDEINAAGGLFYLFSIRDTASIYEAKYLIEILKQKSHRRDILMFSTNLTKAVDFDKDYDKFVSSYAAKAYKIFDKINEETLLDVSDFCEKHIVYEQALKNQEANKEGREIFRGHKTSLIDLDKKTNGLCPGHLIVVGARPGCGKSTLMINLVHKMKECKSVVFSLEMGATELATKLLLMESEISQRDFDSGILSDTDIQKLYGAGKEIKKRSIIIDDQPGLRPSEILGRARSIKASKGLDLIFIDYLQLMRGNDGVYESNQVKIAAISRELKEIAKLLKVPVVALAQLNREVEKRESGIPRVSDLRESGSIEADADQIWLLHKTETDYGVGLELIIGKNRFGETGSVKLHWNLNLGKMESSSW
jgi:replicative DNA helicase